MVLAVDKSENADRLASAGTSTIQRLSRFLAIKLETQDVRLLACDRLEGGAVQENWRLRVRYQEQDRNREESYVLRTSALSELPDSRPKIEEFAILHAAWKAGIQIPEPLWLCMDRTVIGAAFLLIRDVPGNADGRTITTLSTDKRGNPWLADELARQLAKIHEIKTLPQELAFLRENAEDHAAEVVRHWRARLSELPGSWPALEWGLRWCENHLPAAPVELSLVHGDFRTGNYLIHDGHLNAILDWEFAQWGDPMSDIGWFCAACWRFDRPELEAGGVGSRADFYQAYEIASGRRIDRDAVFFWEVLAHVRWAIIACQQGLRFYQDGEASLDLGLTGRLRPAQVQELLLKMTPPSAWRQSGVHSSVDTGEKPAELADCTRRIDAMNNPLANVQLLASAVELFREQIVPVLPPEQTDNGRMIAEALGTVLCDLSSSNPNDCDWDARESQRLALEIRNGSRDSSELTHLELLGAVSAELKAKAG